MLLEDGGAIIFDVNETTFDRVQINISRIPLQRNNETNLNNMLYLSI